MHKYLWKYLVVIFTLDLFFKKWERKDEMVTLGGTVALKHIFSDSFDVVPEHFSVKMNVTL